METIEAYPDPEHKRFSAAWHPDPRVVQQEPASQDQAALDSVRLGAGVVILIRRFAAARITTWPDGGCTVLRTIAEQQEARAVLSDAQWVVPVTADGYLLPSV